MDNFDLALGNVPVPASIEEAVRKNGGTREEQQEIHQAVANQPAQEISSRNRKLLKYSAS
jgi:hypothetical protein